MKAPGGAREAARAPAVRRVEPAAVARDPQAPAAALARGAPARSGAAWLARAGWAVSRTGRTGLVGLALLGGAGVFLASTHLAVRREVAGLQVALAGARAQAVAGAGEGDALEPADPGAGLRALPARTELPAQLRQLFQGAASAHLAVDTARYELSALRATGVVKYQVAFPVTGPYPQVRAFIDATLAAMPSVALSELAIDRKAIGDGDVEARLRWTLFLRGAP